MKINTLRLSGVLLITSLLFGCATSNIRQVESEREGEGVISFVDSVRDGKRRSRNLDGATNLETAVIGGQTYLFVAAWTDDAVSVFSVADNGRLTFEDDIKDGERGADNLWGAVDVETAVIGGQTYLFVAAYGDSAVSVFSVADNGRLSFVDDIVDGERGANNLLAANALATAVIGGQTYLFVASSINSDALSNKAVSVFSVADNGRLTFADDIVDGYRGADQAEIATASIGGQTYLFVSVVSDSTVSAFSVANNGRLTFTDDVRAEGFGETHSILLVEKIATAVIGGQIYLFAPSWGDDAVNVFSIEGDGSLTFVDNAVANERDDNLWGASSVATARIGGQTYLFVAADSRGGAVSLFSVADNGRLSFVDDIVDGERGDNYLYLPTDVAAAIIGGQTYLFASSLGYDAVSAFRVNLP